MCRISGIISKQYSKESLSYHIQAMNDSQQHGGPDGEGSFIDERSGLAFGHRRLALLDLSTNGQQPMCDEEQKFQILFNGEIYNYLEIRSELFALGYSFKTQTDTEVILKAYIQWGEAAFRKLNGMFAISIYDLHKQEIILARDIVGIKPLYYHVSEKGLVFASEVKAFQHSGFKFKEQEDWKIYFLSFGFIPEPFTTLKNVLQLKPGYILKYNLHSKSIQTHCFERLNFTNQIKDIHQAHQLINQTLEESVKRHLISDAPIGVFLSGGIDSSLIALLAAKVHNKPINTLSVTFHEEKYSEKTFQKIVNQKTGGKHTYYQVTEDDYFQALPQIKQAFDQPSNDAINTWFITKCAKEEGLKAVLSGLGGDELFGGYPSFGRMQHLKRLRHLPLRLFGIADHLSEDRLKKFSFLETDSIAGDYLFFRGFYTPKTISKLIDATEEEVSKALKKLSFNRSRKEFHPLNYASWLEQRIYMRSQLLKDTDYMSMQHGIEVRVPFLDKEFLKLVHSLSPSIKYSKDYPKKTLVESFGELLPQEIYGRKKMGFTFPFQEWNKKHPDIENLSKHSNKTVHKLANNFLNNKLHWSRCFALLQIQDYLPKIDALFLSLKTFSHTGGIEKVNRILMKAGTDIQSDHLIRFNALSLYDSEPDEKYINKRRFKGHQGHLRQFIYAAVKKGIKSDVVMLSHINLSLVGVLIKIFSPQTKVILQAHGIEVWKSLSFIKKKLLNKVDIILPVSDFTKQKLTELHGVNNKKCIVLNNSLDPFFETAPQTKHINYLKKYYDIKEGQKIILTLTRMSSSEKYKGYDQIINALPEIKAHFPTVRYLLAGKYDSNEIKRVRRLVKKNDCKDQITFLGFVPDEYLSALFSLADVFVMPSKKEGFGIVFIEAMACGIPVIGGNADGTVDALKNGLLGSLIDPDNAEELKSSIINQLSTSRDETEKQHLKQKTIQYFGYSQYRMQLQNILLGSNSFPTLVTNKAILDQLQEETHDKMQATTILKELNTNVKI